MIRKLHGKKCGITWRGLAEISLVWLAYLHNTNHYLLSAAKSTLSLLITLIQNCTSYTIRRIFEMLIIHITLRATSCWELICRAIISLFLVVVEDTLISIFISLSCAPSELYTERDIQNFLEWKFPIEMALLYIIDSLTTCWIFVYAYVHISKFT